VSETFGIEPSKTLNQSEALAHGTTIYGAKDAGLFYYDYSVININLIDICACWNYSGNGNFFGENDAQYKHKQIIFSANCKVPSENLLTFGNEGPVEMYIYNAQPTSRKTIGYVRFQTPNKIRFILDSSKVVTAILENPPFDFYRFYDKKEEKWIELKVKEQELLRHEERLRRIYELKNDYEAKIYALKNKMSEYKEIMN
jgi:hypothetical protein